MPSGPEKSGKNPGQEKTEQAARRGFNLFGSRTPKENQPEHNYQKFDDKGPEKSPEKRHLTLAEAKELAKKNPNPANVQKIAAQKAKEIDAAKQKTNPNKQSLAEQSHLKDEDRIGEINREKFRQQ